MIIKEIKKDFEFIKNHTLQPSWFKTAKILLLLGILLALLFILGLPKTIIWFSLFFILSLIVHVLYRIKTDRYTKSWMDFKVEKVEGKRVYERIGFLYYSLVAMIFLLSTITVIFLN